MLPFLLKDKVKKYYSSKMTEIQTKFSIGQRLPKVCCTGMLPFLLKDKVKKYYGSKMTEIQTKFSNGQRLPKVCCS